MGRTNGKLIPFLKDALENEWFCNLKWIDRMSGTFSLVFPRFEKKKDLNPYEAIFIKWYLINGRLSDYPGYSKAKAVIKAALNKSVYLVVCSSSNRELRYQFATNEEIEAKRRRQKEQSSLIPHDPSPSPPPVLSPNPPLSDSSGYQSGIDDFDEEMQIPQDLNTINIIKTENSDLFDNVNMDDFLKNPESSIDFDLLDNLIGFNEDPVFPSSDLDKSKGSVILEEKRNGNIVFEEMMKEDIVLEEKSRESIVLDEINLEDRGKIEDSKLNGAEIMQQSNKVQGLEKPVVELNATAVSSSRVFDTYWLCTQKLHVDSTLLLICEKQVIQDANQDIAPGHVDLNNALKPGELYNIQKHFELNGKYFLFLLPNN